MGGTKSRWNSPESKIAEQRILRSLKAPERKFYFELAKKIPPERILEKIGSQFSGNRRLMKSNISDTCRDLKGGTVTGQRVMEIGLDVLTAVKKSDADLKILQRMLFGFRFSIKHQAPSPEANKTFFGHSEKVFWRMFSDLGTDFLLELDEGEKNWLSRLPTKQKYAYEWEMINPLLTLMEGEEGKFLLDHLSKCTATPCRCREAKDRLNLLINSAKVYHRDFNNQFVIFDSLIRERNEDVKFGFVKAIVDIYGSIKADENARERNNEIDHLEAAKKKPGASSNE